MLDQGKTYRGSILPLLLAFAVLGALATLALMRLLRRKVGWGGGHDQEQGLGGLGLELEEEVVEMGPVPVAVQVRA